MHKGEITMNAKPPQNWGEMIAAGQFDYIFCGGWLPVLVQNLAELSKPGKLAEFQQNMQQRYMEYMLSLWTKDNPWLAFYSVSHTIQKQWLENWAESIKIADAIRRE
jgi:hypothetical protein